jgi:ketosteroid isomerase-like protein
MLPSNAPDWDAANPPPQKGGRRLGGGLIVTLGLLVVLVAVIAFAVTRLPTGPVARPAAPTAAAQSSAPATAAGGITADAATQQAIQDVIQKVDNAQEQAVATNNPQLTVAAATPEFNAEQTATNQDLLANGVTEVKLLNMEWGQITVNGNSASATVYETWSMTLDDGTTVQSRDRNIYTLIKDNSGNWIVQADDHPDQQGAAPTN